MCVRPVSVCNIYVCDLYVRVSVSGVCDLSSDVCEIYVCDVCARCVCDMSVRFVCVR